MRMINFIMRVIFFVSSLAVGLYWANRIITLPDAAELATKSDIRAVKAVVVDQSTIEERKRRELAVTDKQRHEELIKKLKIAQQQQRENMKAIAALRRKLNAEAR